MYAGADHNEHLRASLVFTDNGGEVVDLLFRDGDTFFDVETMQVYKLVCVVLQVDLVKNLPRYFPMVFVFERQILFMGHDILDQSFGVGLTLLILLINLLI